MKSKLNLTIDEELIPLSKAYARKKGKSVSQLVESLLLEEIRRETPSFAEKWRGRFQSVEKEEPRYKVLRDRYEL